MSTRIHRERGTDRHRDTRKERGQERVGYMNGLVTLGQRMCPVCGTMPQVETRGINFFSLSVLLQVLLLPTPNRNQRTRNSTNPSSLVSHGTVHGREE